MPACSGLEIAPAFFWGGDSLFSGAVVFKAFPPFMLFNSLVNKSEFSGDEVAVVNGDDASFWLLKLKKEFKSLKMPNLSILYPLFKEKKLLKSLQKIVICYIILKCKTIVGDYHATKIIIFGKS